jgi:glutathione S-transferase
MGQEVLRLPAPRLLEHVFLPVIRQLARISHADERSVRADLARLPELLERVDSLIADGTIGGGHPNAAGFQILSSVRVLLEFQDLADMFAGRPCVPAARRLYPDWVGPIPPGLPLS